jgi:hypothetical protein
VAWHAADTHSRPWLTGGCGRELATWITEGRPSLDMHGYDISRFWRPLANNTGWIKERSHEAYATNYDMVFPLDEPLAGRNRRKGPFHEALLKKGCVYQSRLCMCGRGPQGIGTSEYLRWSSPAVQYCR